MIDSLLHYTPHGIVAALLGALGWFGKRAASGFAADIKDAKQRLVTIEETTRVQAENHLATIQANTSKTVEVLEDMRKDQAELLGYIRGKNS
jgi:hypothetical protein